MCLIALCCAGGVWKTLCFPLKSSEEHGACGGYLMVVSLNNRSSSTRPNDQLSTTQPRNTYTHKTHKSNTRSTRPYQSTPDSAPPPPLCLPPFPPPALCLPAPPLTRFMPQPSPRLCASIMSAW